MFCFVFLNFLHCAVGVFEAFFFSPFAGNKTIRAVSMNQTMWPDYWTMSWSSIKMRGAADFNKQFCVGSSLQTTPFYSAIVFSHCYFIPWYKHISHSHSLLRKEYGRDLILTMSKVTWSSRRNISRVMHRLDIGFLQGWTRTDSNKKDRNECSRVGDKDFSERSYINKVISIVVTFQYIHSSSSPIPSAYITHSAAEVW